MIPCARGAQLLVAILIAIWGARLSAWRQRAAG